VKEKRLKYVLFVVVGAIWGFTLYKYFFYTPEQAAAPVSIASSANALIEPRQAPEPYHLLDEYRDPFLSRTRGLQPKVEPEAIISSPRSSPPIRSTPLPAQSPSPVNWKQFRYLGLVEESKGGRQVGLLSISGNLRSVEVGGAYSTLEVLSMNADSIRIRHQEIEKNIGR